MLESRGKCLIKKTEVASGSSSGHLTCEKRRAVSVLWDNLSFIVKSLFFSLYALIVHLLFTHQ